MDSMFFTFAFAFFPLHSYYIYVPFCADHKLNHAEQFALTESSYVIVRLMQEFKSIEARDSAPFTELLGLTLANKNGTLVGLTPA